MFGLFFDMTAFMWLILWFVVTVFVIYFPLYIVFFYACKLDGPLAIRLAWTVGLLWFLYFVTAISQVHSRYLAIWRGDMMTTLPDFLVIFIACFAFLVWIWVSRPRLHTS